MSTETLPAVEIEKITALAAELRERLGEAAVSDEDAKTKFPKGWDAKKPYLRVTPQPNK